MKLRYSLLLLMLVSFFHACKKEDDQQTVPVADLLFQLKYEVDGQAVFTDSIIYLTDAGYQYSIVTLNYYLSELCLIKSDGTQVKVKDYQYASLTDASTNSFSISTPPKGDYTGISFNIGIDSAHNIPDGLPVNTNNNNMIWPVAMGGGYHFMKFEGYFSDSSGTNGYAMHLGRNNNLIYVSLNKTFTIGDAGYTLQLTMNLNEWFHNPQIYDFNIDGNYSMSNPAAMAKLAANGKDVFHF